MTTTKGADVYLLPDRIKDQKAWHDFFAEVFEEALAESDRVTGRAR